jgi:hypothetical protein
LIEELIEENGAHKLMSFLFWSLQTDFSGHGNSILGVGGRGSARAQCRMALRCIRALVSHREEPQIISSFLEEGLVDLLLLTLTNVNNLAEDDTKARLIISLSKMSQFQAF